MGLVAFVKPEHAQLARDMEQKLLSLSPDSGILFVGVEVSPTKEPDEIPQFRVFIGCGRSYTVDAVSKLAFLTLSKEIVNGAAISIEVHRGRVRG